MPFSLPTPLRRKGVLIATGTAVLLAVGTGTGAAFAASGDTPSPAASTSASGFWKDMPTTLKTELKQLRAEPRGSAERKADWKKIVEQAHNGDFGQRYYYIGRLLHGHHRAGAVFGERYAALPANLKADLKTLRSLPPRSAERKAERQKIEANALAGDYGTAIKARAEKRQARHESATPSSSTGS